MRHTQVPDIGWAADDRNDVGVILDLSGGTVKLASEEITRKVLALDLGEAYKTRVYNFEVEEFHTYYVGEQGVWVHNVGECQSIVNPAEKAAAAVEAGIKKAEYEKQCFSGETLVFTDYGPREIDTIWPGSLVLARCENTGEIAFRKVIQRFEHVDAKVYRLYYIKEDGTNAHITTTAEHPFWVKGRGWTATLDLQPGDVIETCDGRKYIDEANWPGLEKITTLHQGATVVVMKVGDPDYYTTVYNLQVEDFHTYFVGAEGLWVHNTKDTREAVDVLNTKKSPDATTVDSSIKPTANEIATWEQE